MKNRDDLGQKLREQLTALKFEDAIKEAERLKRQTKLELLHKLMIAEVLYYTGRDEEAENYFKPYVKSDATIQDYFAKTKIFPMRWRLMIVQYLYAKRELESAMKIAEQLLETCKTNDMSPEDQSFEEGEVEYYLVQIARRKANYDDLLSHALRAIALFTASDRDPSKEAPLVRWRLGQVLLIFGSGAHEFGDPRRDEPRLQLAHWLLKTLPDSRSYANVLHALGSMLRARGTALDEAKRYLDKARELYESSKPNHPRDLSGIHINLGIYWLSQHAHYVREDKRDPGQCEQAIENAKKEFSTAAKHADGIADWASRRAEIHVWRSWLAQEQSEPDFNTAKAEANMALSELATLGKREGTPYHIQVEAHLALGNALFAEKDFVEAERSFDRANTIATEQKLRKHQIHSHLCLAELLLKRSDLQSASDHFYTATEKIVPDDKFPESAYLHAKRDRIERKLKEAHAFYLVFDEQDHRDMSLNACREKLDLWLIKHTYLKEGRRIGKAAEQLKIPRQRLRQFLDKHDIK